MQFVSSVIRVHWDKELANLIRQTNFGAQLTWTLMKVNKFPGVFV